MTTLRLPRLALSLGFAAVSLFTFAACEDDDDLDDFNPPAANELRHDGPNDRGPRLPAGLHRFGVRFSESELADYAGRNLTGIRVFIGQAPESLEFIVYQGGDEAPGFDVDIIRAGSPVPSGGFFDYEFVQPLPIDADQPLWIVAEVMLPEDQQSIGCDAGPAEFGGDWLWSEDGWETFRSRTGESVNWNLRGIVE